MYARITKVRQITDALLAQLVERIIGSDEVPSPILGEGSTFYILGVISNG